MGDNQSSNHKYSNISAKKIKFMSAFRWLRILITTITVLLLMVGPFLPAFMKWLNLSEYLFELSYEEYLVELRDTSEGGFLTIGIMIGGIAGGCMFYASSKLSILGMLSSVASIIVTQKMYNFWPFTLILIVAFVLGFILTFGGRLFFNTSEGLKNFIFGKETLASVFLLGLSVVYFYTAIKMPQDLAPQYVIPPTLIALLFLGGILFAYLFISALFIAQIDDDKLMFLEARESARTLIRIEYDKVTDYGRHPENW